MCLPIQKTQVRSLGGEDPKGIANHRSGPAWRIPGTEEADGLQSMGSQRMTQLSDYQYHCLTSRNHEK